MRQPRRHLYADLTKDTFSDFLDDPLSEDNFLMYREIKGEVWAAPAWVYGLDYEHHL